MNIESTIGIVASLLTIGTAVWAGYKILRDKSLSEYMTELADKNTPAKRQKAILHKINVFLMTSGHKMSIAYINDFHSNGRSKLNIFYDMCIKNDIEPTAEICKKLVGADEPKFRKEWFAKRSSVTPTTPEIQDVKTPQSPQVVYMSSLLQEQYPETCKRLTDILTKHNIPFAFLKGTKDIWCRDYMPVLSASGKLIQFKYDPSYLRDNAEYMESRSDVKHVCEANGIHPVFSDINLDGGNVVMYKDKAIITDRIYSENPNIPREELRNKLSELLEAQVVVIPAYPKTIDFTGHADGMIRFVNETTVICNDFSKESDTWRKNMERALRLANLTPIEFPLFDYEIKDNHDHAIGVYLNYLEVGNLIVMPVFGYPGNKDAEALAKLKEVFPDKIIETIDYNEVALTGGILNCTTWVTTGVL